MSNLHVLQELRDDAPDGEAGRACLQLLEPHLLKEHHFLYYLVKIEYFICQNLLTEHRFLYFSGKIENLICHPLAKVETLSKAGCSSGLHSK